MDISLAMYYNNVYDCVTNNSTEILFECHAEFGFVNAV